MGNDKIIAIIKDRLLTEHNKYYHKPHIDWAEIAARKIYSSLNEISIPPVLNYTLKDLQDAFNAARSEKLNLSDEYVIRYRNFNDYCEKNKINF